MFYVELRINFPTISLHFKLIISIPIVREASPSGRAV